MTAQEIIRAIIAERWRESFVLPNYTPAKWWECDVFELSEAGYFKEYEVKVSRADFFVDAQKTREVFPRPYGAPVVTENKHELLAKTDRGPVQFWFVTPKGLLKPEEIPVWAGLMEAELFDQGAHTKPRIFLRETTKAPRRHKQKLPPDINHARGTCYYRFHNLLQKEAA
jgi:hypothetical protein